MRSISSPRPLARYLTPASCGMRLPRPVGIASSLVLIGCTVLSIATGVSCSSSTEPGTPVAPVYLDRSLHESELQELASPGGMVRLVEPRSSGERLGYGGLLLVRSLVEEQFYAYDLACPHEAPQRSRLEVRELEALCLSCESRYEVVHGSGAPISGVSRSPLRRYRAQYIPASHRIVVTN